MSLFESLWVSWLTRTYVMHSLTSPQQFVSFDSERDFARSNFRFEVLHMASSGSNKAGPSKRIFEQLEKGVAAEHAPSVSSKSDGSATSIPDAGQMSSGSNMGSTEGTRFLHKQHRRHSPKAMREQAAPKAFGCSIEPAPPCWLNWTAGASQADMESRSFRQ